ncbi:hypothetical protein SO694_0008209 [Aureococcus anophagefferens]|uniref:Phytase-like domain-containing protein n=1 Tax=Aureococcus anophagefferens TaxID=44056 RepID=A0ABR1FJ23_AURAN
MAVRQGWLRIAALSLCVAPSSSTGKGPVGIFAVDATHVVITDSNFAALFAVDTRASRRVGDFFWPVDRYNRARTNTTRKQDWVSPTGVGSCAACATAWVSSNGNDEKPSFWRVDLARPLAAMAQTGTFDELASSRVVARPVDGRGVARLADAGHGPSLNASLRMVAIAPNGRDGYVAAMGYGVLVFDATDAADGGLLPVAQLRPRRGDEFELRITALSGLQFSSDDGSALLATDEASFLRLADVSRRRSRATFASVGFRAACGDRHARDVVEAGGAYYVLSGPQPVSDAKGLYRVDARGNVRCALLTSDDKANGWRDGAFGAAQFSRPHAMARLPGTSSLAITDIDNRVLRLYAFAGPREGQRPSESREGTSKPSVAARATRGGSAPRSAQRRARDAVDAQAAAAAHGRVARREELAAQVGLRGGVGGGAGRHPRRRRRDGALQRAAVGLARGARDEERAEQPGAARAHAAAIVS